MIKLVLILVVLVAVAAGGIGMAGIGPLADLLPRDDAPAAAATPPAAELASIEMETFGVPLFAGDSVRARLLLNLTLKVERQKQDAVKALLPRLQAEFVESLLDYLPRHAAETDLPEAAQVAAQLLSVAHRVAGTAVREVEIRHLFAG